MNTKSYAGVRIKAVKINPKNEIGKTLSTIRKIVGKKRVDMDVTDPWKLERHNNQTDVQINTLAKYLKDLGIDQMKIQTNCGTNTKIFGDQKAIGLKLKSIRLNKGLTLYDIKEMSNTTVYNIEKSGHSSGIGMYISYMCQLGISEAKIFV